MYPSEINSQRMRNMGSAVAMVVNWVFVYVVVLVTPTGIDNIGWRFYIIFAVLNAVWILSIIYLYVETAGFSLDEVDHVFELKYGREDGKKVSYDEAIEQVKFERTLQRPEKDAEKGFGTLKNWKKCRSQSRRLGDSLDCPWLF